MTIKGDHTPGHHFNPQKAKELLADDRQRLLKPMETLKKLGLFENAHVLDFGCGPGLFTIPAAKLVGPSGLVLAVDHSEKMLQLLRRRNEYSQIRFVLADDLSFTTRPNSFDFLLLIHTLHELKSPQKFLIKMYTALNNQGKAYIVDWHKKETEHGPPVEHRISLEQALEWGLTAGFKISKQEEIQDYLYSLTLEKIDASK